MKAPEVKAAAAASNISWAAATVGTVIVLIRIYLRASLRAADASKLKALLDKILIVQIMN